MVLGSIGVAVRQELANRARQRTGINNSFFMGRYGDESQLATFQSKLQHSLLS
jgi:hypothetical protein